MRKILVASALTLCFSLNAQEVKVDSQIESVSMFKNGLGVVRREIKISKDGDYILSDVPKPVHGTFWVESDARIITRCTKREFNEPISFSQKGILAQYGSKNVTIETLGASRTLIKGVVMIDNNSIKEKWGRSYKQGQYWGHRPSIANQNPPQNKDGNYITLKTDDGVVSIKTATISSIRSNAINTTEKVIKPVMLFHASEVPVAGATIRITYLTKGIAWIPSYKIDLGHDGKLTVEQKAVIKNEMVPFKGTTVNLISGYPNMKFSHVDSPLLLSSSLSTFFQQLGQRHGQSNSSILNVVSNQIISHNATAPSATKIEKQAGDGVDIHYQNIGKVSMLAGDALAMTVSTKSAPYERLIHWVIPNNRNEKGRYIEDYMRQRNPEKYGNIAWDAIRFKNPFKFPMTTAVASIYDKSHFLGQNLSYWINPGCENLLHITKALSIVKTQSELELKRSSERLEINGSRYYKATVEGRVLIKNTRSKASAVIIDRSFSGKLIKADGKPELQLQEASVYSVNEQQKLTWQLQLGAGEEKELVYSYTVLVRG